MSIIIIGAKAVLMLVEAVSSVFRCESGGVASQITSVRLLHVGR